MTKIYIFSPKIKCAICNKELEPDSPQEIEDMIKELHQNFGEIDIKDCGVVCDSCYKSILN
jgi:uncharacterized protein with PIN domain